MHCVRVCCVSVGARDRVRRYNIRYVCVSVCVCACVRECAGSLRNGGGQESMQRSCDRGRPMGACQTARTAFRSRALPMYNDRNRLVLHFDVCFVSTRILNNFLSTKIASHTRLVSIKIRSARSRHRSEIFYLCRSLGIFYHPSRALPAANK